MKAYVATTAVLFAALTVLHAWRAVVERPARDPAFLIITIIAAAFAIWGARVWSSLNRRPTTPN
jgi:prolipoprotein diacylglyceryltransferase